MTEEEQQVEPIDASVKEPIEEEKEPIEEEKAVVPVSAVVDSIVKGWIEKKQPLQDTITETNQLVSLMNAKEFEENNERLASLLSTATNADGERIFKNDAQANEYLRKIFNNRKSKKKLFYIPKEVEKDIKIENQYSKQVSPMMNRSRLANVVARSTFKSYDM